MPRWSEYGIVWDSSSISRIIPTSVEIQIRPLNCSKPVFKIQILVSKSPLKSDDKHFNGLTDVDSYNEDGMIKFTYGASSNYNEIYRLRKQILDKFPGAFIIAFKNGAKMDVNTAIKEFKANR